MRPNIRQRRPQLTPETLEYFPMPTSTTNSDEPISKSIVMHSIDLWLMPLNELRYTQASVALHSNDASPKWFFKIFRSDTRRIIAVPPITDYPDARRQSCTKQQRYPENIERPPQGQPLQPCGRARNPFKMDRTIENCFQGGGNLSLNHKDPAPNIYRAVGHITTATGMEKMRKTQTVYCY